MTTSINICVFCGSKSGNDPEYLLQGRLLAELMVKHNIGLVYGGGSIGIMGEVARRVNELNGRVISIIPEPLVSFCTPLIQPHNAIVTKTMHERKRMMAEKSSCFIALPGGLGTMEELLEMSTWNQLGVHNKPVGILNVNDYWTPLIKMFENAVTFGLLDEKNNGKQGGCVVETNAKPLLEKLLNILEKIQKEPENHFFGLTTWSI